MADTRARRLVLDVRALGAPDVSTVDVLARMALTARRCGCRLELSGADQPLVELLTLAGLREVLPLRAPSAVEVRGEAEHLEVPSPEEDGDVADPVA